MMDGSKLTSYHKGLRSGKMSGAYGRKGRVSCP
jgi:uncharacterized OB-fold protein